MCGACPTWRWIRRRNWNGCAPSAGARAAESRCPVCGAPSGQGEGAVNPAFDQERYERLRKGAKA